MEQFYSRGIYKVVNAGGIFVTNGDTDTLINVPVNDHILITKSVTFPTDLTAEGTYKGHRVVVQTILIKQGKLQFFETRGLSRRRKRRNRKTRTRKN